MSSRRRADYDRAVRAIAHVDRENVTWVAYAAGALGAQNVLDALLDARPADRAAIRGAYKLSRRHAQDAQHHVRAVW